VALGASGIIQTPAHAQSSPGSSAVASAVLGGFEVLPTPAQTPSASAPSPVRVQGAHGTAAGTVTVGGSFGTRTAAAPVSGLDFGYESESGWGFAGTVWTGDRQPQQAGSSLSGLSADVSDTRTAADQTYAANAALRAGAPGGVDATTPLAGVGAVGSTIDPLGAADSPENASLEAEWSPTASPLEAQSLPLGTPMQAQTPAATTPQQAQSSGTATASPAMTFTNTVQVIYWMPSVTASVVQGSSGWSDNLFGLDYRLEAQNHWGIHLVGVTGSENAYTLNGTSLASLPLSGNDALWSADLFYRWYFVDPTADKTYMFGLFTGYGGRSINLNTNSLGLGSVSGSSNGIRFGAEGAFQIADGWAINLSVAYEPSDTLVGSLFNAFGAGANGSVSATGQGWDYVANVSYTTASQWVFTLGYWWSQDNLGPASVNGVGVCPCSVTWQGPYLTVGKQF